MDIIKQLGDGFCVTGQVTPEDMASIASMGFRSIIGNRPDDEDPEQPDWQSVAAAAAAAGLETRHIPVGGELTVSDQSGIFAHALADMPKPILAFCRTGNRSTQLFEAVDSAAQSQTED